MKECCWLGEGRTRNLRITSRTRIQLSHRGRLWVILCRLPEKGRKEIEEREEEMKEKNREERETGMKVKKQKK